MVNIEKICRTRIRRTSWNNDVSEIVTDIICHLAKRLANFLYSYLKVDVSAKQFAIDFSFRIKPFSSGSIFSVASRV